MGARALAPAILATTMLFALAPAAVTYAEEPVDPAPPVETVVVTPDPTPVPDLASDPTPDPTIAATVVATPAPAATPKPAAVKPVSRTTEAQQIIAIAKRHLGARWRYGATGPTSFDCSGLVIYAFNKAGDARAIARGHLRSARAIYRYYKAHGHASRSNPKLGDLVIWGGGSHIGIYIGHGKAISTLSSGVKIHRVFAVTARFTAYLHTGMWKART